jgi:Skp family chaperone for outer membrane proteins
MKKVLGVLAAVMVSSSVFAIDAEKPLVSIDSIMIMQKSKEGQKLAGEIQKDISKFQAEVQNSQKELAQLQEQLKTQVDKGALKAEAKQEKVEALAQKRKELEQKFTNKEEQLRASIQKRQLALRDNQLKVINKVFEKEQWGLLIDKNTPGVLCVSNAIDKTPIVLAEVDKQYSAAKPAPTKVASNKPSIKSA